MTIVAHVSIAIVDDEDAAEIKVRRLGPGIIDIVVADVHMSFYGGDAGRARLLATLERLYAEVEDLP